MLKEINLDKIRSDAETLFKGGKLLCAEAVLYSLRANAAPNMPKEMIAAVSGFPVGVGGSECMCGTISAGVMYLGYLFGRDFPTTITDPQSLKTITLSFQFQEKFKNKHKALCCHVQTKGLNKDNNEHLDKCSVLVGDAAVLAAEMSAKVLNIGTKGEGFK